MFEYYYITAILSAILLGFSKAGFKGIGFLVVTLMAVSFESKASTGILVPMLILADIFAIYYYRNDVNWPVLWKLFVPMAIGVFVGVFVGDKISVEVFKYALAAITFFSAIMIVVMDRINAKKIPDGKAFALIMGFGAGFCTMVGNLAGAFTNIYFLAMRFPKRAFIGTAAWLFFFINILKLPFHIFIWETINLESLKINLYLAPFIIIGFYIGLFLIEKVSNEAFKKYIIVITIIGAFLILLKG